ncbi:probable BOI-related E3 ubiquitin-protein ligase 2 [Magnolia sinica]|uniref:probable BOI-related E3 ubiquitin-protein ligase 2 n=1 Tax=Magnolia sinica TaxID=86752 RepID=UPI002659FE97|nr:probable BOI-related E3 ubiquitin-protein ligase 2 [Magnolia sinica]
MAVQAQYPSNAFSVRNGVFEELQMQFIRENQSANLLRGYSNQAVQQQILHGTVFSDQESELTCNASGSRKRNRTDQMTLGQQQHFWPLVNLPKEKITAAEIPLGVQLSHEENRLHESAATSTSGRSACVSPSPLAQDLLSCLYQQNIETDAFIRLQNEKLRLGLDETRKRHFRSLLSVLEQQVLKRLKEKEAELDNVRRRNAELEEKVKQLSAENQIWCHVARNNEAMVSSLRTNLEQVLLQNSGAAKEGYGDSSGGMMVVADDAQSCCYEGEETDTQRAERENRVLKYRKTCKACRENDVSVLLLPCRHLCLCKDCESKLDSCPICKSTKNASVQVFMS